MEFSPPCTHQSPRNRHQTLSAVMGGTCHGGNLLPGAGQDLMSSSAVGTACWLCPQLQQGETLVPETLPAIAGGVLCALSPARVGLDRSCHAGKVPKALPLRRSSPLLCKLRVRSSVSRSAWGRSRPSATPPCPPRPGHSPQGGCCHRCGVAFTCKGRTPLPCAGRSRHHPASPGRARGQWGPAGGGERSPRAVLAEEARGSVQDAQSLPSLWEQMVLAAQPPSLPGPEWGLCCADAFVIARWAEALAQRGTRTLSAPR